MSAACRDIGTKSGESKPALYIALINDLISKKDVSGLQQVTDHLVLKEGSDQYGRTYIVPDSLMHIITELADEGQKNPDPIDVEDMIPLLCKMIDVVRPRGEDYPEVLLSLLDLCARCYQALGEFRQSAVIMSSYKFDDYAKGKVATQTTPTTSFLSPVRRLNWHVQAAEFWLAVQETGSASQQIKRAHALINEIPKSDRALLLRFRTCYARVLDNERRFLEASYRYFELSTSSVGLVSEKDALKTLEYAVTCAILAKPSASRSRLLAALSSDDRVLQLNNSAMLDKIFNQRLITAAEVKQFDSQLQEHQRADTSTGMTVLQNSILEHNIAAAARLYHNVKLSQLAVLLGVKEKEIETITATMIEQQRLQAQIDQVAGVVEFVHNNTIGSNNNAQGNTTTATASTTASPATATSLAASSAASVPSLSSSSGSNNAARAYAGSPVDAALLQWDSRIEDVCLQVNRIVETIQHKYPQYAH